MSNQTEITQVQGFLYSHDFVTTVAIDKETGEEFSATRKLLRNLPHLKDTAWINTEVLIHALRPSLGKAYSLGSKGTWVRNIYFNGVQGPKDEKTGKNWPALLIGRLMCITKQDEVTGDSRTAFWVAIGNGRFERADSSQKASGSHQDAPQKATEVKVESKDLDIL